MEAPEIKHSRVKHSSASETDRNGPIIHRSILRMITPNNFNLFSCQPIVVCLHLALASTGSQLPATTLISTLSPSQTKRCKTPSSRP